MAEELTEKYLRLNKMRVLRNHLKFKY